MLTYPAFKPVKTTTHYNVHAAPSAKKVSVVGDFNYWNDKQHPLNVRWDDSGIWEGFIPEVKEEILDALLPLYYGKVVSYIKKTERMSNQQAEEVIEKECMIFEENKKYLVSKWQ